MINIEGLPVASKPVQTLVLTLAALVKNRFPEATFRLRITKDCDEFELDVFTNATDPWEVLDITSPWSIKTQAKHKVAIYAVPVELDQLVSV